MVSRKIGIWTAMAIGLGSIIGAGIFVLSGTAIALAGSGALIAFILVGIVALIVALELRSLGTIMPKAKGASYSFVYSAFGSELGFITGILLYFSMATSISVIALGFGSYLSSLIGAPSALIMPAAIAAITALALVNLIGLRKAARADVWLVSFKVLVLLIFAAFAAIYAFSHGSIVSSNLSIAGFMGKGLIAVFSASVAIVFAYSGFQTISTLTPRVAGGPKNAGNAILFAVLISMTLYVLVTFALLMLAPASSYSISGNPLSFALSYSHSPSWLSLLVGIGAIVATLSATIAILLGSSRLLYQIGEDHLLPKIVRLYNNKSDVATSGVVLSAIIAIIALFSGNIYIIASISNFGLLFSYLMTGFALVHFKRSRRKAGFGMPLYPYTVIIGIVGVMLFIVEMPREALAIGLGMTISLLVIYYFIREYREKMVVRVRLFK